VNGDGGGGGGYCRFGVLAVLVLRGVMVALGFCRFGVVVVEAAATLLIRSSRAWLRRPVQMADVLFRHGGWARRWCASGEN
jgi:hypothetical protein